MKSLILSFSLIFAFLLIPQITSAIVVVNPKVEKLYGFNVQKLNLNATDILKLDAKTIETKTGQKLSLKQKAALKVAKWQVELMKKMGKSDAQIMRSIDKPKFKFHWPGFLLGFFLSIFGVLIAYMIFDGRDAGISSIIGFSLSTIILAILLLLFYVYFIALFSLGAWI
jgi:hypothetical protein